MASTKAEEVSTHAVSPVSILGGGAGAAAGGVPPGAGALVAGGASVVVCAITPFVMTPRVIHATMPDTISRFTITRCRTIVFIAISFCSCAEKKGATLFRLPPMPATPEPGSALTPSTLRKYDSGFPESSMHSRYCAFRIGCLQLDVVVQEELIRVRPDSHLIDLFFPLIRDPGLNHV